MSSASVPERPRRPPPKPRQSLSYRSVSSCRSRLRDVVILRCGKPSQASAWHASISARSVLSSISCVTHALRPPQHAALRGSPPQPPLKLDPPLPSFPTADAFRHHTATPGEPLLFCCFAQILLHGSDAIMALTLFRSPPDGTPPFLHRTPIVPPQ